MILEFMTLKIIWWLLIGMLMAAFAITGGMDIGVGILLPFVGKSEEGRRLAINAIGPTWEGNQVWLVTFGAALFAVWPTVYATAFSCLYLALLLVVLMLILRPPGIDYRSKIDSIKWRATWDLCLFIGAIGLALIFGVAVGNLFIGLPFFFTPDLHLVYSGNLFTLLSPLALLFGLVSFCMFGMQGALYLQYKLEDQPAVRAKIAAHTFGLGFIASFVAAGIWVSLWIPGYKISTIGDINSNLSLMHKTVTSAMGGWLNNYTEYPLLWALPISALLATRIAMRCSKFTRPGYGLLVNSIAIACTIATAAAALFPFILPSTSSPNHSLTVWDSTSSHRTLACTFAVVVLLLPVVLSYTAWVYKVMRGKVKLHSNSY